MDLSETRKRKLEPVEAVAPPDGFAPNTGLDSYEKYKVLYDRSLADPKGFWSDIIAEGGLHFENDFDKSKDVFSYNYHHTKGPISISWFPGAKTNLSYNALDRNIAQGRGDQPAQVYVAPFVPGVTYTATSRGCGSWIGTDPAPRCQQLGPLTAAL